MCKKINAEFLLASMFSYGREKITFQDLKNYCSKIYKQMNRKHIFLDISSQSIYAAINNYPEAFCLSEDNIIPRPNSSNAYFSKSFILNNFGRSLDNDIKEEVFDLLKA